MKKFLFAVFMSACLFLPVRASALKLEDYKTLNLKEALDQEKIEYAFDDYEETDKQVPIYLFRGNGCGYCRSFLTFLNNITEEYGEYFKLVSFEVWDDSNNATLMYDVADFLGETVQGVPFIIIGDKTFAGYASDYDDSIKAAIKDLYESEDRYDVFEKFTPSSTSSSNPSSNDTTVIILMNLLFVAGATVVVIAYTKTRLDDICDAIEELQKKKK